MNQNGERVAAAQYRKMFYFKDENARIQYVIALSLDKRCVVYCLDGSVYDEFAARDVGLFLPESNGSRCGIFKVDTDSEIFFGGNISIYSLREKKLLPSIYYGIQFIDRHTLLLSFEERKNGEQEYTEESERQTLYDLDTGELVQPQGFAVYMLSSKLRDHVTHLPATKRFTWDEQQPEGYLTRAGEWVDVLPKGAILPRKWKPEDEYPWYDLSQDDTVGGQYKWRETAEYQGYVDKRGEWVWREARQYAFLED